MFYDLAGDEPPKIEISRYDCIEKIMNEKTNREIVRIYGTLLKRRHTEKMRLGLLPTSCRRRANDYWLSQGSVWA